MVNLVDIIESIIKDIDLKIDILGIDGDKVTVCKTLHITVGHIILDLEGNKWKVTEIENNTFIRLEAYNHVLAFDSTAIFAKEITYLHGDPASTNQEYLNESRLTADKTPFVWLVESYTYGDLPADSSLDAAFDVRLFLMDWAPEKWFNDDHNNFAIKPMTNLQESIKGVITNEPNYKRLENFRGTVRNRFGEVNGKELIIDERLSGIELTFKLEVYDTGACCGGSEQIVFPPVIVSVNSDQMTVAPSGSTVNVLINDSLGVEQGVRVGETFEYIVPAGVALVRIYNPPAYSGAADRGQDFDTYWRMINNIGNYSQPMAGVAMRLAWGKYYLLHPDITIGNIFGNPQRWTGTGGGYFDWDTWYSSGKVTVNYYTVEDVLTTRELAFPDGLAVDHWIGGVIPINQTTTDSFYDWLAIGATMTIGAFTGFYAISAPEGITYGTWGDITLPYTNSPLFQWGTGAKLTGDSYPASGTNNAMVLQAYGHMTSTPKGNNNKIIFYKPIDINTIFG